MRGHIARAMTERMFKVLVIGDSGVGKTAFVNQYVSGHYKGITKQTFGVAFALKVLQWSETETMSFSASSYLVHCNSIILCESCYCINCAIRVLGHPQSFTCTHLYNMQVI
jgi:GTPase SAR1 family protein